MIRHHDIPWFNPRQMDDATVRALSTGRENLLRDFFLAARQRLREPSAGKHWLVLGPRGAGKSFFLRLVQCRFTEAMNLEGKTASIVLLPEEQPNVFAPHEWLQEVQRLLPGQTRSKGQSPVWQVKDEAHAWQTALESLLDAFKGNLLVIAVENFDQLLAQAFDNDVRSSRLRNLMENEPRIMLLASAVEGEFDEAYEKRLFRQFEHHPMPRWDERDHRDYLTRRAKLQDKEPTNRQLAKIDAYSRFTGGSARTAAVLAASILDEQDPLSASHDLMATLDRMSDYYRALIEKMPPNTRKIFDNLVRGGEPASQVELANRIQARQSDISKAFRWLTDYGYVINEKQPGSKEHSYRVSDRLFVQFYRMRYIDPDQPCQLAILADLLAATIEFSNKWKFAESYLGMKKHAEAELMARLACEERGVDVQLLPERMRDAVGLLELSKEWVWMEKFNFSSPGGHENFVRECFDRFQTDREMKDALDTARSLADAVVRGNRRGSELVHAIDNCSLLAPINALSGFADIVSPRFSEQKWDALRRTCLVGTKQIDDFTKLKPEFIPYLEKERRRVQSYPLAESLTTIVKNHVAQQTPGLEYGIEKIVNWAARATRLWYEHGEIAKASDSFDACYKVTEKLLNYPYMPGTALAALQTLETVENCMTDDVRRGYYLQQAFCFAELEEHHQATSMFAKVREFAPASSSMNIATWSLQKIAFHQGEAGLTQIALETIDKALAESREEQDFEAVAWSLGLKARLWLRDHTVEFVWNFVNELAPDHYEHIPLMMSHLGMAIVDRFTLNGEASAFGFATELLREAMPHPDFLRRVWITLVNHGLPFTLLRDLLAEVPSLVTGSIVFNHGEDDSAKSQGDLVRLCHTLEAWLDYLAATPEKRAEQLHRLDPDLAATLEGLSKNLSPKAQHRYGIVPDSAES